jgi:aryl-alcohol dehydrogenase-like predicted oxidoreductase
VDDLRGSAGDLAGAIDCLTAAREGGIDFFDTAEAYGRGRAEAMLGAAIQRLGWDRATFVLSTKLYWGLQDCVNLHNTLNRKYLLHAIDGSLERLQTTFVDILSCHRPDPETPIEETVWAMSDIMASGKAHYWGTSEWPPSMILSAYEDRRRLVAALGGIARELNVTSAQLAIAWCTRIPDVSTVIRGASNSTQLRENLRAMAVADQLSPAVIGRIEDNFS